LLDYVERQQEVLAFDAHDVVPDLLGDDRIGYEFDEIVYGVYGRVHALETLDLLADGQRVVGERRVAVVIRRTAAVHCSVTSRTSLGAAHGRPKTSTTHGGKKTDDNRSGPRISGPLSAADGSTNGKRANSDAICGGVAETRSDTHDEDARENRRNSAREHNENVDAVLDGDDGIIGRRR